MPFDYRNWLRREITAINHTKRAKFIETLRASGRLGRPGVPGQNVVLVYLRHRLIEVAGQQAAAGVSFHFGKEWSYTIRIGRDGRTLAVWEGEGNITRVMVDFENGELPDLIDTSRLPTMPERGLQWLGSFFRRLLPA